MDFNTNRHSVYKIIFHLVVVTKYRHGVINKAMNERLKEIAHAIFAKYQCSIIEIETESDHCHILFEARPQTEIVKLVNSFKTVSSRLMRKEFSEHLKPFYWKPYFWSNSYCIVSTGGAPLEIVKNYIQNQNKPS